MPISVIQRTRAIGFLLSFGWRVSISKDVRHVVHYESVVRWYAMNLIQFLKSATLTAVIPRACGVSNTPRHLSLVAVASGILDRPVKPGDDDLAINDRHDLAFPRRETPGLCMTLVPPEDRGRRESRVPIAPMGPVQRKHGG
jgi:hypothetical protein